MTADLVLDGCRSEPLGSYLKALGVFRLVAEQLDPSAIARWDGDRFVLATHQSIDDVVRFFVDMYRPTPIVSPWNGGSGFHPKDNTDGITAVEGSTTARLRTYRTTVARARELVAHDLWDDLSKEKQVTWCRNELPDAARPWLDTAVVLADGAVVFPPILGTGGNVGRLDFSNNFMQRVADVLTLRSGRGAPSAAHSEAWLRVGLAGTGTAQLIKGAVGQFDPGGAGGTNAAAGGPEQSLVNPWDFVLMLEGALLFASGAARRMGPDADRGKAAMPFTFDVTPVGYGSAVEGENAKGELWAPLWSRLTGLAELRRFFGEGRMEWRGAHARRGIDAARAAASLGVDRGINGFGRHVFVERMGQAMLAVPVGRVPTTGRPRQDVAVLGELDEWVGRVRRATNLPAGPRTALRRLDRAMFDVALHSGDDRARAGRLQDVLAAAAELERTVARSRAAREGVPEPLGNRDRRHSPVSRVSSFDAQQWVPLLDDGSPELRLAVAVASGRDRSSPDPAEGCTPASLLRAIRPGARGRYGWRSDGRAEVAGLGALTLVLLLGALMQRRAIGAVTSESETMGNGSAGRDAEDVIGPAAAPVAHGPRGIDPAFAFGTPARPADLARFLVGEVDQARLHRLLGALLLLQFRGRVDLLPAPHDEGPSPSPAAALILPFFHGRRLTPVRPVLRIKQATTLVPSPFQVRLLAGPHWPRQLAAGRVEDVVRDALYRLRVVRLEPRVGDVAAIARGVDGPRLLAAAAFRLGAGDAASLLARVAAPPADQSSTPDPEGEI